MQHIRAAGMTIVFVNTRAQAELMFQALWKLNDATLPIAPAFFRGAIVIVSVRAVSDGAGATATTKVVAPNPPAPPDDTPSSVR